MAASDANNLTIKMPSMPEPQALSELGDSIQDVLMNHYRYLQKISLNGEYNCSFRRMALFSVLNGYVTVIVGNGKISRQIKRWTNLRKLQKSVCTRLAS